MKTDAEMVGYTVVDPPSVVSTHLTEVLKDMPMSFLGRQETKQLIDHLKENYPILLKKLHLTLYLLVIFKKYWQSC